MKTGWPPRSKRFGQPFLFCGIVVIGVDGNADAASFGVAADAKC